GNAPVAGGRLLDVGRGRFAHGDESSSPPSIPKRTRPEKQRGRRAAGQTPGFPPASVGRSERYADYTPAGRPARRSLNSLTPPSGTAPRPPPGAAAAGIPSAVTAARPRRRPASGRPGSAATP